ITATREIYTLSLHDALPILSRKISSLRSESCIAGGHASCRACREDSPHLTVYDCLSRLRRGQTARRRGREPWRLRLRDGAAERRFLETATGAPRRGRSRQWPR